MDIKYFYLNNQMKMDEYIMIQLSMIRQEFVEIYNLSGKSYDGYVYAKGNKGNEWNPPSSADST